MPTDVIRTIGATSSPTVPDYTSLQAWEDACPADLTTADQRWIGECLDQGEFTVAGTVLTISGVTTDSTRYIILRCAGGASFRDKPDVRSRALVYNASNGVAARRTTNYGACFVFNTNYLQVDGLQLKGTGVNQDAVQIGGSAYVLSGCIIEGVHSAGGYGLTLGGGSNGVVKNNLIIGNYGSGSRAVYFVGSLTVSIYGNTLISTSGRGMALITSNYGGGAGHTLKNNAVLGFGTAYFGNPSIGSSFNATDAATFPGTNNKVGINKQLQFEHFSTDFRAKITSDLHNAGTPLADLPTDISGATRHPSRITIGCWEYVHSHVPDVTYQTIGVPLLDTPYMPSADDLDLENPINWDDPLNRGLVSWWLAHPARRGQVWHDLARKNHGTLTNGPAWSGRARPGGYGSLSFDGTNDLVYASLTPPTGQLTLSTWFCSSASVNAVLVGWNNNSTGTSGTGDRELVLRSDGVVRFYLYDGSARQIDSATGFNDGKWHHAAGVVDSVGMKLYVDGIERGTAISGVTGGYNSYTTPFLVAGKGQNNGLSTAYYNGYLDDIVVRNVGMSAAEIRQRYVASLQGYADQLNYIPTPQGFLEPVFTNNQIFVGLDYHDVRPAAEDLDLENPVNWDDPLNRGVSEWWLAVPSRNGRRFFNLARNNHGTLAGSAGWSPEARGGGHASLKLAGGVTGLTTPSKSPLAGVTTQLTYGFWFLGNPASGDWTVIFSNGNTYVQKSASATMLYANIQLNDGSLWALSPGAGVGVVFDNKWHFVTIVYDGLTHKLYVDCRQVASTTITGGSIGQPVQLNGTFTIGAVIGNIDDVFVYNRALSAAEIRQRYVASLQGYADQLNYIPTPVVARPALTNEFVAFDYLESTPVAVDLDLENPINWDDPLNRGLVGHWLSHPAWRGETFYSLTGKQHGSLLGGPTWKSDTRGGFGGLSCDGTDDYVDCGLPQTLDGTITRFTMAGWFKANAATNVGKLSIGLNGPRLTIQADASTTYGILGSTTTGTVPNSAGWHHYALVYDGPAGIGAFYFDGRLIGAAVPAASFTSTGNKFVFGQNTIDGVYSNGTYDDVRLYNRALAAHEIHALYNASLQRYPDQLNYIPQPVWQTITLAESLAVPAVEDGTSTIIVGVLEAGTQVYGPTIVLGALTVVPDALSNSPTISNPTVALSLTVVPDAISNSPTISNPTVALSLTVVPDAISNSPTISNPTMSMTLLVTPDVLSAAAAVAAPTVTVAAIGTAADLDLFAFDTNDYTTSLEDLDLENPINWDNSLNRGLISWWLSNPATTGSNLRDLVGSNHAVVGASTRRVASSGISVLQSSVRLAPPGKFSSTGFTVPITAFTGLGTSVMPDFTIVFDCLITAENTGNGRVLFYHHTGSFGNQLRIGINTTNFVEFSFNSNAAGSKAVPTETPVHLTFVKRGTGFSWYLNGVFQETLGCTNTITGDDSLPKTFFQMPGAAPSYLWSAAAYSRPLSQNEVFALYQSARAGYSEQLNYIPTPIFDEIVAAATTELFTFDTNDYTPIAEDLDLENPLNYDDQLNRGITAYWRILPQRSGQRLHSLAGEYHGTIVGPVPSSESSPGGAGSLHFDGSDDYVSFANKAAPGEITVDVWFRPASTGSIMAVIGHDPPATGASDYLLQFNAPSIGKVGSGWVTGQMANSVRTFAVNKWIHATMVRRGTTGSWRAELYIDGVLESFSNSVANPPSAAAAAAALGRRGNSNTQLFNGHISEATVYSRALSAQEVARLHNEAIRGYPNRFNYIPTPVFAVPGEAPAAPAAQTIVPNAIDASATVNNPALSLTLTVTAGTVAAATTVYNPTGALTLTVVAGTVAAATSVYNPTGALTLTVVAGTVAAATTVYNPTGVLTLTVVPGSLAAGTAIYEPIADQGTLIVVPGTLSAATTVSQPTITLGTLTVVPTTITSNTAINNPTLAGVLTAVPNTITATASVYQPTMGLTLTVVAGTIAAATTVSQPVVTVGTLAVIAGTVAATTVIHAPDAALGSNIVPQTIAAATTVGNPTASLALTVVAGTVAAGTSVPQPTVSLTLTVSAGTIAAATTVSQPTAALTLTVTPTAITDGTTVYEPANDVPITVVPDVIVGGTVYEPLVVIGITRGLFDIPIFDEQYAGLF